MNSNYTLFDYFKYLIDLTKNEAKKVLFPLDYEKAFSSKYIYRIANMEFATYRFIIYSSNLCCARNSSNLCLSSPSTLRS